MRGEAGDAAENALVDGGVGFCLLGEVVDVCGHCGQHPLVLKPLFTVNTEKLGNRWQRVLLITLDFSFTETGFILSTFVLFRA